MHSYLRVIIFVVSIFMEIGSTRAICAKGQFGTIITNPCTEPARITSGDVQGSLCNTYAAGNPWAGWCIVDNNCNMCPCSCAGPANSCPPRAITTSEVCSDCPAMYNAAELTGAHANGISNGISKDCIEIYQDP